MTTLFDDGPGVQIPDTTAAQMAARKLRASAGGNVNHVEARQLEALQGIGFALLAIAGQLTAQGSQQEAAGRARFRFRRARSRP